MIGVCATIFCCTCMVCLALKSVCEVIMGMDKVEKIHKEVERLIGEYRLSRSCEAKYRIEAYKELLKFIDNELKE